MKLRTLLQNGALIILSLAAGYLVIEFLLFPQLLTFVPLKLHFAIKEELRVLAQSSKKSVTPGRYLALFGDSYSQGYGDWLLDVDPDTNAPYHSAHVLHELTGREVITFGKSGSGSLSEMVGHPIRWLDYIDRAWVADLPDPEEILVYFYEGNDLNDNLADLKARFSDRNYEPSRIYEPAYFRRFIQKEVIGTSPFGNSGWEDYLFFSHFLGQTFDSFKKGENTLIGPENISPGPGIINRVRVGGREISVPDGLQSPALELSSGEIHLGVFLFEQALQALRQRFPKTPVTVVYLPSVLSCYEITSPYVSVQIYDQGREPNYPARQVHQRSDFIAGRIRAAALKQKIPFLDTRPALRRLGRRQLFHGPKDWKHYNREGYTVLAKAIYRYQIQHGMPRAG